MPIPKKLRSRVEQFITIVLTKVVNEELDRAFFQRGKLDSNYTISLYSTGLLPLYNDNRIEVVGKINDKETPFSILSCASLTNRSIDKALVEELTEAFMKLRIKEIK